MVKVAPEDPSSLTSTCLVSALSWVNNCFFLVGAASLASGAPAPTCGLESKFERHHGLLGVPLDGEDTFASRHLHEVVGRMSRCHELGQSWVPENGVVREADAGDVEVDQLSAVVVARAEGDGEVDLPQGAGGTATNS